MNKPTGPSQIEIATLSAVQIAVTKLHSQNTKIAEVNRGWLTVSEISEFCDFKIEGNLRVVLLSLAEMGYLKTKVSASMRNFKITPKGQGLISAEISDSAEINIDSSAWTGVVSPVQIEKIRVIMAEIEDVCDTIRSNHDKSQIMGLLKSLDILLNLPDPPRTGIVSLIRDPAFSNIIQFGTFVAALIAAVKP